MVWLFYELVSIEYIVVGGVGEDCIQKKGVLLLVQERQLQVAKVIFPPAEAARP